MSTKRVPIFKIVVSTVIFILNCPFGHAVDWDKIEELYQGGAKSVDIARREWEQSKRPELTRVDFYSGSQPLQTRHIFRTSRGYFIVIAYGESGYFKVFVSAKPHPMYTKNSILLLPAERNSSSWEEGTSENFIFFFFEQRRYEIWADRSVFYMTQSEIGSEAVEKRNVVNEIDLNNFRSYKFSVDLDCGELL